MSSTLNRLISSTLNGRTILNTIIKPHLANPRLTTHTTNTVAIAHPTHQLTDRMDRVVLQLPTKSEGTISSLTKDEITGGVIAVENVVGADA
jgi:hypothetical protein